MMNATYTKPVSVGTNVKSDTQRLLRLVTVKLRFTRSSEHSEASPGIVVSFLPPRETPCTSAAHIRHTTVQRTTERSPLSTCPHTYRVPQGSRLALNTRLISASRTKSRRSPAARRHG